MALPLIPLAGLALSGAGLGYSMFGGKKGGGAPDISGEMSKISELFAKLRAQSEVNINRQAGQARGQAASNMAARGVYRAPVAENTFNVLEGERLNNLATSDAQIGGQEAQMRAGLLRELLGLGAAADLRKQQAGAATAGMLTGLGSNLLAAYLRQQAGSGQTYGALPGGGYGPRFAGAIGAGDVANYGPSANF